MENFTVKCGTGGQWISTTEVQKLVEAVVARCAQVAQTNPAGVKDVVVNLDMFDGFNNNSTTKIIDK